MRLHQLALIASLAVSVPAALAAQTTSTTDTNQNGNTTTSTTTTDQDDQNSQGTNRNGSQTSGQGGAQSGTTSGTAGSTGTSSTTGTSGSTSGTASGSTSGTTSGATTGSTAAQTGSVSGQTSSSTPDNNYSDHAASRFIASGFIGSNYSNNSASMPGGVSSTSAISSGVGGVSTDTSSEQSVDFGFSAGWLWRSIAGAEFVADFTPNFNLANSFVASDATPALNTYMFNLVGAVPLGADARFQPYVSGGWGAMTLRGATLASGLSSTGGSSTSNNAVTNAANNVFDPDESHAAGNIGFGMMAFMGGWGVRGDIRYFRAFGSSDTTLGTSNSTNTFGTATSSSVVTGLLPELDFWRANIGLAFRF